MSPTATDIFATLEATWPPARTWQDGPWCFRDGAGGGQRVSATTAVAPVSGEDIQRAETAMSEIGQPRLFMIRDPYDPLDRLLAQAGYLIADPTLALHMPVAGLTDQPLPPVTAFTVWEPLAIMVEIWARGGTKAPRLAVMHRAQRKTAILGRAKDRPAGVAFIGLNGDLAMVHSVEVSPDCRRLGVAEHMMRAAAFWAQAQGATTITALCVKANAPAQALYSKLGFRPCCGYHYRKYP